jgi:hypothetical protein
MLSFEALWLEWPTWDFQWLGRCVNLASIAEAVKAGNKRYGSVSCS